ncbi:amidohydrolase [Streptomonospora wellingtoniae]|uniref:Peptidase M20 domain-containing protein 2 n=1 Tax=Streptomonospora wellingtoniae TaxID=3075544 RepID=A0ABU2KYA7_9ACTN|nr:amidohydrolase [Streptomonospora sp. DSM 45055]MDT0304245.1 amidohydrolase [Streptomonospora sp. DSM 45055]
MPDHCGELRSVLDGLKPAILSASREIHAHPEVRFTEHRAAALLERALAADGFDVESGAAGMPTAFAATAGNSDDPDAPTIALFCEYDALEGLGHGCGHNVIAAAGLGASQAVAAWLARHPEFPGTLRVLGSPAEEGGGGKAHLIEAGYLDGVDAALMVHPAGQDRVHMDALARVALEIEFQGRASHAAGAPEHGVNALDAASLTLTAIGLLRQQLRSDSRVHAIVTDGGQAPNIIPARAALRVFVRSPDDAYLRDRLLPAVKDCARGAALATGAQVEITQPTPAYAALRTNGVLAQVCAEGFGAIGRALDDTAEAAVLGSTDMGNVSAVVPSAHPCLELAPGLVLHTPEAAEAAGSAPGDRAVLDGALLLADCATRLYAETDLISAAHAAHHSS